MTDRKVAYLAGPMTGYQDFNYPEFYRITGLLRSKGYVVINPAESVGGEQGLSHSWYMRKSIHDLLQADMLIVMNGWNMSDGAKLELVIASRLGLPTFHLVEGNEGRVSLVPLELIDVDVYAETGDRILKHGRKLPV